jgi:hypothetical protein
MNCEQAVILAGGAGTRLKAVSGGKPKALTDVAGKPVIDHLIGEFLAAGVTDFLLLLGVGAEPLQHHVEQRWVGKARFAISREDAPRGTGGALVDAMDMLADSFFLCFGDVVFRTDLEGLRADLDRFGADAMMTVHPNDHPFDSDAVLCAADGRVTGLSVAPHVSPVRNRVNAGVYAMRQSLVRRLAAELGDGWPAKPDLEKHLVAPAVGRARLFARELTEYLRDMGTPERLALAERDFAAAVPARLSDPNLRAGFLIALDALFDLSGPEPLSRPAGVQALRDHIGQGYFPAAMLGAQPTFSLEKLDEVLGAQGSYVWDYVLSPPGAVDSSYFARRCLVADQTVFMANDGTDRPCGNPA